MLSTGTDAGQGRALRARKKSLSGRKSIFASPVPSRSAEKGENWRSVMLAN